MKIQIDYPQIISDRLTDITVITANSSNYLLAELMVIKNIPLKIIFTQVLDENVK